MNLEQVLEEFNEKILEHSPELASSQGDRRYDHLLSDPSPAGIAGYLSLLEDFRKRLLAFEEAEVPDRLRISLEVCRRWAQVEVEEPAFETHLLQIDPFHGFQLLLPNLFTHTPLESADDCRRCLERLERVAAYVEGVLQSTREGMRRGMVQARPAVEKVIGQLELQLKMPAGDHPFSHVFRKLPPALAGGEGDRLRDRVERTIAGAIYPALDRFRAHLRDDYLPRAREEAGVWSLPRGGEIYDWQVRRKTTTALGAEEIHRLGLREVERIRSEMEEVKREVGFEGSLLEFFAHLRSEPRFYHVSEESILEEYRSIARRADGRLPGFFGKLPRIPYQVIPVPDYAAAVNTTAYYQRPSLDGRRPGYFYANIYDLRSRPRYEMEALTLHEAVPGHHLQIARQMEIEGLPRIRAWLTFTAFVEGWGLYAERLGKEMGFYQDPYSEFGRLIYEMWRSCRLVVDTGINRHRWTRADGLAYLAENTPLSRRNMEGEVDRYLVWPAQALSYKIGEMKIRELRARAERELGPRFDLRAFHDHLLDQGSLPLDVLERVVEGWIGERRGRSDGR